ncbi:MAG: DUF4388 domain-containing protein [Nitrospirota bacterium]
MQQALKQGLPLGVSCGILVDSLLFLYRHKMAFTGDLEHLHIVDIIQLIHTTRKSGTFSVRGNRGESRIIFSNGYIVGANHLNSKIRIGAVLVEMKAIAPKDLQEALEVQGRAGKDRKPLIATLIELGRLKPEDATKGLKKLIEMTLVELIGWTSGTFTLDTEAIDVSSECKYLIDKMEQAVGLDAQMVLMDALRVFDERERDRKAEKHVPSYEEVYVDAASAGKTSEREGKEESLTAEDLGLADVDHLTRKIPQTFSVRELFEPVAIHRQIVRNFLGDLPVDDQEAFVSFLKRFSSASQQGAARTEEQAKALVLFSGDGLTKHSVMTICKKEGVLVFATEDEGELDSIMAECLSKKIDAIMVFDGPQQSEGGLPPERIVALRRHMKVMYPRVPVVQMVSPLVYSFTLQSFCDGVRAVIPKPLRNVEKETSVEDTMQFLETFKCCIDGLLREQEDLSGSDVQLKKVREQTSLLRTLKEPSDISLALLQAVAGIFERSITFVVRQTELVGERAMGVSAHKNTGPTSASKLKIPLTEHSVFRDALEKGEIFCGDSEDPVLREHLYEKIGSPLGPTILLLPLMTQWKAVALTYADFGRKEPSPVPVGMLEILSNQAVLAVENAVYRKHAKKASRM